MIAVKNTICSSMYENNSVRACASPARLDFQDMVPVPKAWRPFHEYLTRTVSPYIEQNNLSGHGLTVQRPNVMVSKYFAPDSSQEEVMAKGQMPHRDYNRARVLPHLVRDPKHFPLSVLMTLSPNGRLRFWERSLDAENVHVVKGIVEQLQEAGDCALWHGLTVHEGMEYVAPTPNQKWPDGADAADKDCAHVRMHWYTSYYEALPGKTSRDRWPWDEHIEKVPLIGVQGTGTGR